MIAALRLWWLLRSTSEHPRDGATTLALGLATWSFLSGARLVCLARAHGALDHALLWALGILVVALALTAAGAVSSLLRSTDDRRPAILRTAGASRAQTAVVCALDVVDSALPGVIAAVLAHLALWWLAARAGIQPVATSPLSLAPWLLLVLAAGVVVTARVRSART